MIHSVKDFVDKKMNNKLICFNNVSDDYLFFYDIKKDSFCATKRNKKHIEDDHVFLDDYKNIKEKIYFKDRNIIDNLYNKIICNEIHAFHVSFRIDYENQRKWYECKGNKIDQKEIVVGTIYEKNKLKVKEDVLKHIYWAINHDFEGFELYYQPIIDINTKSIIALEALLRFKMKDEYIQPKEFISLLEQTHLILPVGRWVLKTAMESCKELQRLIPGLKMNVNLSFVQVNQNNSVQMILDILKEIEIDTTLLGIEIKETGKLNSNQYYNFCIGLEKGKIALILDDYGFGFSNVNRLATSKPQYIKIDHSFTKQIIKSDYYRKILKNTITMAHDLGLLICIEGIEESAEYDVIKSLGADYMQGYLFARPMDKHSFIKDHKRMSENFLNN